MYLREKILRWVNSYIRLPVVGLDISDLSVKFAKLGGRRRVVFEARGEFLLPAGIIQNGEIKDAEALKNLLSSWIKRDGRKFASSFFAVSLPEEKGFLRLIQIPKVKREDVGNAVRWEIEGNIPLGAEELYYDYEVIERESESDHLDVMITAFPRAVVNSYVDTLTGAGLRLAALELEPQAAVRAAVGGDLAGSGAKIIADLGRTKTGLAIFAGGAISFTATAKLSGKMLEENVAGDLNISIEEARARKERIGLDPHANGGRLFLAFLPPLSSLADELKRTMDYYRNYAKHRHGVGPEIEEILLSGGEANILGLDTYLASVLKVPVRRAYPAIFFHAGEGMVPEILRDELLSFTIAIGLSLRGVK